MTDAGRLNRRGTTTRSHADWLAPLAVAIITFVVFLPALKAGFVTWDDDKNFLNNPYFRGLDAAHLRWMWTTFHLGHYVPLTWMTLGLDYVVWGMNPAGYHLTNVLLHMVNAVLVYFLARRLLSGGRLPAVFSALLFAIHPLRVESVAWVTVGTTLGMLTADGLAVFIGDRLGDKVPMTWVRRAASALFIIFGLFIFLQKH